MAFAARLLLPLLCHCSPQSWLSHFFALRLCKAVVLLLPSVGFLPSLISKAGSINQSWLLIFFSEADITFPSV